MGAATPPYPGFIQGGEFRLILFSSFAANCLARSGSLKCFPRPSAVATFWRRFAANSQFEIS
ncbi:MAG: hypothetical protein DMG13_03600 [Acidobacteria bacterium]|nr:MAG: hypothetical protein DMG13_03600 [Acidobacteriota bacterium]